MDLHLDLRAIIEAVGYVGLFAIVFAESGLFFGFFLPGDSLLFTAGFLASQGLFSLPVLIILLSIGAIAGDSVGYWCGEKFGRKLFTREDSFWFHKKHLVTAHEFYERHGGKAIVLARFLPAVRTFVPIVAGMGQMSYRKFLMFNIFGGLFWVIAMTAGGYYLTDAVRQIFGSPRRISTRSSSRSSWPSSCCPPRPPRFTCTARIASASTL